MSTPTSSSSGRCMRCPLWSVPSKARVFSCSENALQIDKAFRIATPMRKASWTKRFAEGWGERRGANGDGGSGGEGWREWAGGVSEKSLPRRAALEKPRPLWLEDAAQGCRNRRFRSPARQGHGTPKRGYSPRNRVRQLPQWGHRGRAASRSAASSTARSAGSVSSLNASERLDILSGCAASAGVARIKSNQARLDWSRFEGCQSLGGFRVALDMAFRALSKYDFCFVGMGFPEDRSLGMEANGVGSKRILESADQAKSPRRILVRSLLKSRNKLREKYRELRAECKRWRNQAAAVERSRSTWRKRALAHEASAQEDRAARAKLESQLQQLREQSERREVESAELRARLAALEGAEKKG